MLFFKLIIKNTFRHGMRTILTIMGLVIALIAFGLLRTVIKAWYSGVEASSSTRLITRNAISLIFPLPLSYKDKIKSVEGVTAVSYGNWFGGIYIDQKHFFANFAVDPKSYLKLYPEYVVDPAQKEAFLKDRRGFLAGRQLADKYGWKLGDTVTLKGTIYPGDWDFVLRAIYKGREPSTDEMQFIFHWNYVNEYLKGVHSSRADQVGFYMEGIERPDMAAQVAAKIDALFKNSLAETLTETEKAFQLSFINMTETILAVIQAVSFIVIAIIMAVAANTMAMTVRERIGEYAIMKTLGMGAFRIGALIFGESLTICAIGCGLGIALTYPAARVFAHAVGSIFPSFDVDPRLFIFYAAASFLVGVVAAIVPTWRAVRVPIAEGLRRIG